MTTQSILSLSLAFLLMFTCSCQASLHSHDDFLHCLSLQPNNLSSITYTPRSSSYSSILRSSIRNLRFASETTPKPLVIVTPTHESQIPPVIYCAKETGMQIRTRSGGHDYEGLSYVSKIPFLVLDLVNLSEVTVDADQKTAWVQGGAQLGQVYYRIAEKSRTLAFPGGVCPTVGVGGHISGGGYGTLIRKYGIAADHVIDARIVDVNGRLLDRNSMGEDLFWAIRGGGGASFGVIVAWKLQLVDVPEIVTVFTINRTLEQNATDLVDMWQHVAPKLPKDLTMFLQIQRRGQKQITVEIPALFLGGVDRLLSVMGKRFPELNLVRENCTEMSWIESTLYFAGNSGFFQGANLEVLLNRREAVVPTLKAKSDYVQKPIPKKGIEGIWRTFSKDEANNAAILMVPYGGRMAEVPSSALPFPHRAGNLFKVNPNVYWRQDEDSEKYIRWIRRFYRYMTPYVSKYPRAAYINYRDLDLGVNNINGNTSYAQASIWGKKYFKDNFNRLVQVKTKVDPTDFFRNEQSIPPLMSSW